MKWIQGVDSEPEKTDPPPTHLKTMITGELKARIDNIWNTMWSGVISNPLSVIEQLTYLLFIKRLDELQTLKENKAASTDCYPFVCRSQDQAKARIPRAAIPRTIPATP